MATAFALPAEFPERDLVVLTAFAVVLATLVIQGATLAPIVGLFRGGDLSRCAYAAPVGVTLADTAGSGLD